MQSKKFSLFESIVNTLIGFMISLVAQLIIYPAMNIDVTFLQNIKITLLFTSISILRGYVIRRFFNGMKNK
jgi:hypothetical protein